jgi:hypothetical protein
MADKDIRPIFRLQIPASMAGSRFAARNIGLRTPQMIEFRFFNPLRSVPGLITGLKFAGLAFALKGRGLIISLVLDPSLSLPYTARDDA